MNYRHLYHAGNFADVFKHIVLVALIQSLLRKDSAFCYVDTHAGLGKYDLLSLPAQTSKEYESGIQKIFHEQHPSAIVNTFLNCIKQFNNSDELRFYPGSPYFVRHLMRPQDRMILTELHDEDYLTLKKNFSHDKQVAVHHLDGYQGLKAFLPPKERRGLVLIDPPYEKSTEWSELSSVIPQAIHRWNTGIYALWYPIKKMNRELEKLCSTITRPSLTVEFSIYPEDVSIGLSGCGLLIVNPPWQLAEQLNEVLAWLWKLLSIHGQGKVTCMPSSLL